MSEDPSTGTIHDSTGNNLDGTTHGMVTGDRITGQVGTGLYFDGSNNWVSLGTSTLLQPPDMTVSCWLQAPVSWDSGISWIPIYAKDVEWYSNGWFWEINYNSDGTCATSLVVDGSNPFEYFFSYDQDPDLFYPVGQWVFVSITLIASPARETWIREACTETGPTSLHR